MNYALFIKNQNNNNTGANLKEIEQYLKTTFKSFDYMIGFLDGYLFNNYRLLNMKELEEHHLKGSKLFDNYYLKIVTVNKTIGEF